MAKITGKNYADAYKSQEERGSYDVPPTGTYHVVNTALQRKTFARSGAQCIEYTATVLAVVESQDESAKKWVGKTYRASLWMDLSKPRNAEAIGCMGIAHGATGEWDTDSDKDCVASLTGVPYQAKVRRKVEEYDGKQRPVLDVYAVTMIAKDARAKYTDAPDWKKTAGHPSERMQEAKTVGSGNGSSSKRSNGKHEETQVAESDPFGDIPF
jgi:hypothetical protein